MLVCHNTLSISSSTLYSPVSYSKHNSSHPKDCFTHESFWMPFPSVCYLVPCFDISLYGHSAPVLISGKVITVARAKFPPPGIFIPRVCTVHKSSHVHTRFPSLPPFYTSNQSLCRTSACQHRTPVINSLITSVFCGDSLPLCHTGISYITLQLYWITKHNLHATAVMAKLCWLHDKPSVQFGKWKYCLFVNGGYLIRKWGSTALVLLVLFKTFRDYTT